MILFLFQYFVVLLLLTIFFIAVCVIGFIFRDRVSVLQSQFISFVSMFVFSSSCEKLACTIKHWFCGTVKPGNKDRWPTKTTLGQDNPFISHVKQPENEDHLPTKTTYFWS